MRPPCEIITQNLLPLIRGFVAFKLSEKMTQQEVAEKMGVSQPTISIYLKNLKLLQQDEQNKYLTNITVLNIIDDITNMIMQNESSEEIIRKICNACVFLRMGGLTCRKHLATFSGLTNGCTGCLPITDKVILDSRKNVLFILSKAVNVIEKNDSFSKLIPQVMTNICQSISQPKTLDDVAAIPGRITKVKGKPFAHFPPEFGVSEHSAKLLLSLNKINSNIQSLLCIIFNNKIEKVLADFISPISFINNELFEKFLVNYSLTKLPEEITNHESIKKITSYKKGMCGVLINQGALGIEPIAYIYSDSAINLAEKCIEISKII